MYSIPFLGDKIKTRIRDMLFGRPRIKVIDKSNYGSYDIEPIFLIGTFRSGTTLLRYILDSHSHICCPPESKFIEPLSYIYSTESCLRALRSMGYEDDYIKKQIKGFVDEFFLGYMMAHNKKRWADKTPDYVRILDFIEWLYGPDCKYVLIYRNGLDVANSMCESYVKIEKLGTEKDIEKAFNYWMHDTDIMFEWEKKYNRRCYSLKYEELCQEPKNVLVPLFEFLGEEWEEGVMKWYRKGHDRGDEDIKARRQTKFAMSFGNYKKWPKDSQSELINKSKEMHRKIGYDPETLMPDMSLGSINLD